MCEPGLAPDPREEKGIQGGGNSTNSGLEGAWPGKSGCCRRSGQRPDCKGWGEQGSQRRVLSKGGWDWSQEDV